MSSDLSFGGCSDKNAAARLHSASWTDVRSRLSSAPVCCSQPDTMEIAGALWQRQICSGVRSPPAEDSKELASVGTVSGFRARVQSGMLSRGTANSFIRSAGVRVTRTKLPVTSRNHCGEAPLYMLLHLATVCFVANRVLGAIWVPVPCIFLVNYAVSISRQCSKWLFRTLTTIVVYV